MDPAVDWQVGHSDTTFAERQIWVAENQLSYEEWYEMEHNFSNFRPELARSNASGTYNPLAKALAVLKNRFVMFAELFISLWGGTLNVANELPTHLKPLYNSIGRSRFACDPRVCAERELVPIEELLEPFPLDSDSVSESKRVAEKHSLRLAGVVVAVFTHEAPSDDSIRPPGCGLCYLGTFPCASRRVE